METYLEHVSSEFLSMSPQEIELSNNQVQNENRWGSDAPRVALDELIAVFRRRGLATQNAVMIPTHEPTTPALTGEFVSYVNDEHGRSLYYYNTDNDLTEYLEYDETPRSGLLYRIRFWDRRFSNQDDILPEIIDDRPPYRPNPILSHTTVSDEDNSEFVDETLEFVRTELLAQHVENIDSEINKGLEIDHPGPGMIQTVRLSEGTNNLVCRVFLPASTSPRRIHESVEREYGVYEGNTVVLLWKDDQENLEFIDGIITSIDGESIIIDDEFGTRTRDGVTFDEPDQVTLRVVEKGVAERREHNAFTQLTETGDDLLRGEAEIRFSSPADLAFEPELELNTYQERAAVDALRADDVLCIHGPPGTGKTRTLVAIIEHAVKEADTVLVCAHSNQAVDNIVAGESTSESPDEASIHQIVQRFEDDDDQHEVLLYRLGSSRQDIDSFILSRYYLDTNNLDGNIGSADVIASTTNTAAVLQDRGDVQIDLVVIDEATQASGPATSVPFGLGMRTEEIDDGKFRPYGYRTVLAGDHKQLPPFVSDPEMRDRRLHTSLFERLVQIYGESLTQTLFRQYRMHEDIADFASQEFYDGKLQHGEANRTATIEGLEPLLAIDHDHEEEQDHQSNSYSNPSEAQFVKAQVQRALNYDVEPDDVGVITGYSDQRDLIKSTLTDIEGIGYDTIDVETIDKFQGGQREVIIVSFTRSNPRHDSGFLETPPETARKRLNVALTRAKKRLVLIGDWETLSTPASFKDSSASCADTFARLRRYLEVEGRVVTNRG